MELLEELRVISESVIHWQHSSLAAQDDHVFWGRDIEFHLLTPFHVTIQRLTSGRTFRFFFAAFSSSVKVQII